MFAYFFLHRNGGVTKIEEKYFKQFVEFCQMYWNWSVYPQRWKAYEFNSFAILLQLNESADLHVTLIHGRNARGNKR